MSVKLFGHFLVELGEVDASDVREALDLMAGVNPSLGSLAVSRGFMTTIQTLEVSAAQRTRDLCFGELAVELGFLEQKQLIALLEEQRERHLPIGQALVRLGHLALDRLGTLLDAYKTDQSRYEAGSLALPKSIGQHSAAARVIDLLPRLLRRVARIEAKVGEFRPVSDLPEFGTEGIAVSLSVLDMGGLEVALISDLPFAEALATATSGLSPQDLDYEMVVDGVGEFLNVLVGNAASAVAEPGQSFSLGTPDYEARVPAGWFAEVAVGTGRAVLVLNVS